jgi:hypothetical protein
VVEVLLVVLGKTSGCRLEGRLAGNETVGIEFSKENAGRRRGGLFLLSDLSVVLDNDEGVHTNEYILILTKTNIEFIEKHRISSSISLLIGFRAQR